MEDAAARCDEIENELSLVFAGRNNPNRDVQVNMDVWRGIANGISSNGGRVSATSVNGFTIQYMDYGKSKALIDHLIASRWLTAENTAEGLFYSFGENARLEERPQ